MPTDLSDVLPDSSDNPDEVVEEEVGDFLRAANKGEAERPSASAPTTGDGKNKNIRVLSTKQLKNEHLEADLDMKKLNIWLKKRYARDLLLTMIMQLLITDVVFILYAWLGEHWKVPIGAIQVWVGATIIQLIAITHTITKSLFHNPDEDPNSKNLSKNLPKTLFSLSKH